MIRDRAIKIIMFKMSVLKEHNLPSLIVVVMLLVFLVYSYVKIDSQDTVTFCVVSEFSPNKF